MKANLHKWLGVSFIVIAFTSLVAISFHGVDANRNMRLQKLSPNTENCNANDRIFDVSISPDNRFVLASNWRSDIKDKWKTRMWSLETGDVVYDFDLRTLDAAHTLSATATFSPNGEYIFTSVVNGAWIWSTETGMPIRGLLGDVYGAEALTFRFIHSGQWIVIGGNNGADVWDVESGDRIHSFPDVRYEQSAEQSVEVSSDGQYLLSYSYDPPYDAYLVEIKTGKDIFTFHGVSRAILSPTSSIAVTRSIANGIQLWNLNTLKVQYKLHESINVYDWKFSGDDRYFYIFSDQGFLIWDVESGQMIKNFPTFDTSKIYGFLPDNDHIVIPESISQSKMFGLWNITSGTQSGRSQIDIKDTISAFEFTSDSEYVVIATFSGQIQLWDLWKGSFLRQFC